jgi:radical SAM protein with 4Fe4S-binding SPASM domain
LWELTSACNLRCRHCLAGAGERGFDELSTVEALQVADTLCELGVKAVGLIGGEILLRPDWLEIAAHLTAHGVSVGFISNGFALTEQVVRRARRVGVDEIAISLDAAQADVHDAIRGRKRSHRRACLAIQTISEMGIRFRKVITSVSRLNLDQLPAMLEWMLEHAPGFEWAINMTTCHERTRMRHQDLLDQRGYEALAAFVQHARSVAGERLQIGACHELGYYSSRYTDLGYPWLGCVAGLHMVELTSAGDIKGCLALPDSCIEGNVRSHDLARIWRDPKAFAYNRQFTLDDLRGTCRGCPKGLQCRGGCGDLTSCLTGELHHHPFCFYRSEQEQEFSQAAKTDET